MNKVFSYILLFILFATIYNSASAQVGEWVWIHGSSSPNSPGNFGTQGVASATNEPPGLYEVCQWTDLNGNFWFYGGLDNLGTNPPIRIHNDLWKYDPAINQWTWMSGTHAYNDSIGSFGTQGVASPSNRPPSIGFGAASWVDLQGNLWMFGGVDTNSASVSQSNMWKYDVSTNEWTWVKGPGIIYQADIYGTQGVPNINNNPGGRSEVPTAWTDNNGDLWMFGGYVGGDYSDMWRYNITSNTWTWMKGPNMVNQTGTWGIMGVETPFSVPGARRTYSHWKDNHGNLWMFAGLGQDASGASGWYLCDLWRFNISTNNWTWMNGSSFGSNTFMGTYGTKCVMTPTNQPPPRMEDRACWTDADGNFWVFGGFYRTFPWNAFDINDLWKYCVTSNEWTWEGGDNTTNPAGNWGTLNVSSPTNKPDGRMGAGAWADHSGHLYLFGGSNGGFGSFYNDLWKFTIDTACGGGCTTIVTHPVANFISSDTVFCDEAGKCINFTDQSTGNPTSWQWIFTGATPSSSNLQNPDSICYYTPGSYPVQLIITNSGGTDTLLVSPLIVLANPPTPPAITTVSDTLFSSHASYYQWFFNGSPISGATDSFYVCSAQGVYSVQITDGNGCNSLSGGITACTTGINDLNGSDYGITVYPNPAKNQFTVYGLPANERATIELFNVLIEKIYSRQLQTANSKPETVIDVSHLAGGIYFLRIQSEHINYSQKVVKQ